MKIKESKMEKNSHHKVQAEDWMVLPSLSDQKETTYIDVHDLVLYPESLFDHIDKETDLNKDNIADIFESIL